MAVVLKNMTLLHFQPALCNTTAAYLPRVNRRTSLLLRSRLHPRHYRDQQRWPSVCATASQSSSIHLHNMRCRCHRCSDCRFRLDRHSLLSPQRPKYAEPHLACRLDPPGLFIRRHRCLSGNVPMEITTRHFPAFQTIFSSFVRCDDGGRLVHRLQIGRDSTRLAILPFHS